MEVNFKMQYGLPIVKNGACKSTSTPPRRDETLRAIHSAISRALALILRTGCYEKVKTKQKCTNLIAIGWRLRLLLQGWRKYALRGSRSRGCSRKRSLPFNPLCNYIKCAEIFNANLSVQLSVAPAKSA